MASRNPSRPLNAVKNQFRPVSDWIGHICDVGTCPHDAQHVMKCHRLMRHIPKCEERQCRDTRPNAGKEGEGQRGQMNDKLEKCPFNSMHRYPSGKQEEHFKTCKARAADIMARIAAGESLADIDNRYKLKDATPTDS